jgi:hypothetical protein
MSEDFKIGTKDLIPFEEVKVYFVYPFVFEPDNWENINSKFRMGIPKDRLGWIPSQITNCSFKDQKYCWMNPFNTSLSNLNKTPINVIIDDFTQKIYESKLSTLIRIRKSGVGTATFEISINRKDNKCILFDELDPLFRLTPRTWINVLSNQISDSCKTPYLSSIKQKGNDQFSTLFSLFEQVLQEVTINNETCIENIKFFFPKEGKNGEEEADKLDEFIPKFGVYKSEKFLEVVKENYDIDEPLQDTVHPYLYFTGKVERLFYKTHFLFDNQKINNFIAKQIASILFRVYSLSQTDYLNIDFIINEIDSSRKKESFFVSEGLNSKVYTLIHRMASLSFYFSDPTDKFDDIPFSSLNPSLIDVLENTRSKWAILFHSNLVLDLIIYNLNSIENLSEKDLGVLFRALLKVEKLISLSLADQNILLYDGHIAFDAVRKVYDDLNVNHLSRLVQEKRVAVKSLLKNANDLKYYDLIGEDFDE